METTTATTTTTKKKGYFHTIIFENTSFWGLLGFYFSILFFCVFIFIYFIFIFVDVSFFFYFVVVFVLNFATSAISIDF